MDRKEFKKIIRKADKFESLVDLKAHLMSILTNGYDLMYRWDDAKLMQAKEQAEMQITSLLSEYDKYLPKKFRT